MSDPNLPNSPEPKKSYSQKIWEWILSSFPFTEEGKQVKVGGAIFLGGKEDSKRFYVVWGVMAIIFLVLVGRAFYVQKANRAYFVEEGKQFIISQRSLPVQRGQITDTFGTPLAANAPLITLFFNPYEYAKYYYNAKKKLRDAKTEEGRAEAQARFDKLDLSRLSQAAGYPLEKLVQAVDIKEGVDLDDPEAIEAALPSTKIKNSRRLVLLKGVTPDKAYPVQSLKFFGVGEEVFYKRFYPQAEPNAQVVGYMSQSHNNDGYLGRSGIELKYESVLAGKEGKVMVLKSADQYAVEEIQVLEAEQAGKDVVLTVDSRLQYMLSRELERAGQEQDALWAAAIIVEVGTGDVLAMGSWPSFNSNKISPEDEPYRRNRAILDSFEPGSVVKPFTVAAALESGKYNTHTLINTSPGVLKLGGDIIRDSGNYGAITLGKLIQKSSNVAASKIALNLPNEAIVETQRAFGFGRSTTINFPGEASGALNVPNPRDLSRRATISYGYGQAVTVAQLGQAYAALGSGGVFHPLRLVKNEPRGEPVRIIKEKTAKDIIEMMEYVTLQGGTGRAAAIDGYRVAGKTGTSRRYRPADKKANIKGGYIKGEYRALFAGVAPASNPKFAVVVVLERPKDHFGGKAAAPAFSHIMGEALRLYDVPYDKPLKPTKDS